MDFHQVIYPICSVFATAPTLCDFARISYFKSRGLSYGDRRFSIAGPKLWNSIPASLRNTRSPSNWAPAPHKFYIS